MAIRDIIFHGKRLDNDEWVEGWYIHTKRHHCIITGCIDDGYVVYEHYASDVAMYVVDPNTVGQYTGLTDKYGKKIFEGDIFKFPDEVWESYHTSCGTEYNSWEIENYGVVGFSEYYGRYDFVQYKYSNNTVDADMHENNCLEFVDFIRDLEVIGNIHDNPELLGEG